MNAKDEELQENLEQLLSLFRRLKTAEKKVVEQNDLIEEIEKENRKLKFEYEDSLLNRDKALPYKWRKIHGYLHQYCPKCEMAISNWQSYCSSCGQKIKKGNPLPEMEIKEE